MEQGTDVFLSLADQDSEDILHVPVAAMSNVGETICAARPHYDNVSAALRFTGFEHARTHGSEFRSYGEALRNPLDREGATRTHAQSDGQPSTHARSDGEPSNSRLFSFPVGRVSSSAVPIPDSEGADSAGADSLSLAPKDTVRAPALVVKATMQQSADALHSLQYADPSQYIDPIMQHLNTHREGHPGIFRQAKTKGGSVVYLCRSKVFFVLYFLKFCAIQCNPCALRLTVFSCPLPFYSTKIMQELLHHN
jgi:hypothetical protein